MNNFEGQIENFSVVDLMQYLHAEQKTGNLCFQKGTGETAELFFNNGQCVRASGPGITNIGDVLLKQGHVTDEDIEKAVEIQKSASVRKPLGAILEETGLVTHALIRNAVIVQIEEVLYKLISWEDGTFKFDERDAPVWDDIGVILSDLVLPEDVNTVYMLLEAVRKFDNSARDQAPETIQEPPVSPYLVKPFDGRCAFIVVDDTDCAETEILPILADQPCSIYRLKSLDEVSSLLAKLENEDKEAVLITSGGISDPTLLKKWVYANVKIENRLPILALSSDITVSYLSQLYSIGVRSVVPRFSEKSDSLTVDFCQQALRTVASQSVWKITQPSASEAPEEDFDFTFSLLKLMLREGGQLEQTEGIAGQFLNILSEHMDRAILFVVSEDHLQGLGGFGKTKEGQSMNDISRKLKISLEGNKLLEECIKNRTAFFGKTPQAEWIKDLHEKLGIPAWNEIAILPVGGLDQVGSLVYGDNGSKGEPIRHMDLLETAAAQTGIMIENAFLRKQLKKHEERNKESETDEPKNSS